MQFLLSIRKHLHHFVSLFYIFKNIFRSLFQIKRKIGVCVHTRAIGNNLLKIQEHTKI